MRVPAVATVVIVLPPLTVSATNPPPANVRVPSSACEPVRFSVTWLVPLMVTALSLSRTFTVSVPATGWNSFVPVKAVQPEMPIAVLRFVVVPMMTFVPAPFTRRVATPAPPWYPSVMLLRSPPPASTVVSPTSMRRIPVDDPLT